MANWRESIFQVILAIIGSAFFGLILTNLYSIFVQPLLNIQVHASMSQPKEHFNVLYTIHVVNRGVTSATDVRLTSAFNGLIVKPSIFTTENFTSKINNEPMGQLPSSLAINVHRLSPNSILLIRVETNASSVNDPYYIFATYGQNTVIKSNVDNPLDIGNVRSNRINYNEIALIIASIVSFISFFYLAMRRKATVQGKVKRDSARLVSSIINDIVTVKKVLADNDMSTYVFLCNSWESKEDKFKRQTIYNYNEYQQIDTFYTTLKERDLLLLQKNLDYNLLRSYNNACRSLANNISTNVSWEHYPVEGNKNVNTIFMVIIIILGSFVINFTYNFITKSALQNVNFIPIIGSYFDYIFRFVIIRNVFRAAVVFLIILGALKFRRLYSVANINAPAPSSLSSKELIILFVLCLAIMYFPTKLLPQSILILEHYQLGVLEVSFLTIIKLCTLVLIVTRINLKSKLFLKVTLIASAITIISSIIGIIFYQKI